VGLAILWIGSRQSDGGYAARLSAIAVKEDSRSLGIATRLMESLIEFAESSGVIRIDLLVHADNEKARRLYTKVGFNLIKVSNGILKMRRDIKTSD
jgi:ribosomal protein S18 acetylase RimI-like enzyme